MTDDPKWGGVCPRCGKEITTLAINGVCAVCAFKEEIRRGRNGDKDDAR